MKPVPIIDQIVNLIRADAMSSSQVASALKCSEKTAAERMKHLAERGSICLSHIDEKGKRHYITSGVFDVDGNALRSDVAAGWLRNPVLK